VASINRSDGPGTDMSVELPSSSSVEKASTASVAGMTNRRQALLLSR
jgi:hypothetical protein